METYSELIRGRHVLRLQAEGKRDDEAQAHEATQGNAATGTAGSTGGGAFSGVNSEATRQEERAGLSSRVPDYVMGNRIQAGGVQGKARQAKREKNSARLAP